MEVIIKYRFLFKDLEDRQEKPNQSNGDQLNLLWYLNIVLRIT